MGGIESMDDLPTPANITKSPGPGPGYSPTVGVMVNDVIHLIPTEPSDTLGAIQAKAKECVAV